MEATNVNIPFSGQKRGHKLHDLEQQNRALNFDATQRVCVAQKGVDSARSLGSSSSVRDDDERQHVLLLNSTFPHVR